MPVTEIEKILYRRVNLLTHATRSHVDEAYVALCGQAAPLKIFYNSDICTRKNFTDTSGDVDCLDCMLSKDWCLWQLKNARL
jgi:hypothetical protein